MRFIAHNDDMLHTRNIRLNSLKNWNKCKVRNDHFIVGMVNNVTQLLRKKARVQSVINTAQASDAIPRLEMAVCVPCQCCNNVAARTAKPD